MAEHASQAVLGFGTQIQIPHASIADTWVNVEDVISSEPPDEQADEVEVTHYESPGGVREYILGLIEGGEFSYSLNWRPDVYETHRRILHSKENRTALDHRLIMPGGMETIEIPSLVMGLKRNPVKDGAYTADITCKVRGLPVTEVAS